MGTVFKLYKRSPGFASCFLLAVLMALDCKHTAAFNVLIVVLYEENCPSK